MAKEEKMKKRTILSMLLAVAVALLASGPAMADGCFYVDDYEEEGNDDPFQDAINAAEAAGGGIVYADDKTYNETLTIDSNNVWVIGAGMDQTIVDGTTEGPGIHIDADNVIVSDLTARCTAGQGSNRDGIRVVDSADVIILNCEVENADRNAFGVSGTCSKVVVRNCVAQDADEVAFFSGGASSSQIYMIDNVSNFNSTTHTQLWISSSDGIYIGNTFGTGKNNSVKLHTTAEDNAVLGNTLGGIITDSGSGNCISDCGDL